MEQNPNNVEIVLLDDNFAVRYILRTFLQRMGKKVGINIQVHTSADGVQGLGYIFTTKPRIIIVDTTLPQYSGREILEYLATNPNFTSGERKIIVIHDGQVQLKLPEQYTVIAKRDWNFLTKLLTAVSETVLPPDKQWPFFIRLWRLGRGILRLTNVEEALIRRIKSGNLLYKLLYPIWLFIQVIISVLLSLIQIGLPPAPDANLQQARQDLLTFRVKHYPTLITALVAISLILIQIIGYIVGGVAIFHFTGRIDRVQATFGNGYTYRRSITIDHNKVAGSSDLSNFPVLVSGTYSYLATTGNGGNVQNANGYDVIFTSDAAGSTALSHEVESYDAATGAVTYWVKVPTLDYNDNTVIYMFYGNPSVSTSQENKTAVWDSNFKYAYHLNGTYTNGSSGQVLDSTASPKNGTAQNFNGTGTSGTGLAAKIGKGVFLDGTDDRIDVTSPCTGKNLCVGAANTSYTIEAWYKWGGDTAQDEWIVTHGQWFWGDGDIAYSLSTNSGKARFLVMSASSTNGTAIDSSLMSSTNWTYLVGVRDANDDTVKLYMNGQLIQSVADATTAIDISSGETIKFGSNVGNGDNAGGALDEVRLSSTNRSPEWIETNYNSMNNPATFYSMGGAETTLAINVAAAGSQVATLDIPTTNAYVGGAFAFSANDATNVTGITITEQGTVNAQTNLDNIKLYYDLDTSAPYDCASESYAGSESQFGSTDTDGFSATNGSSAFTGTVGLTTTQTACVYVVLDVLNGTAAESTLEIQITNPSTDVTVSAGSVPSTSVVALSGTTIVGSGGFANGYKYRRDITLDHTKVSGGANLTDFPIVIQGTYSYLATTANGGKLDNASGYDLIFTSDSTGLTTLAYEIEKYVTTTGEITVWVKIPTLSYTVDTVIYMFYGNSTVSTSQQNATGVWSNGYKAVLHYAAVNGSSQTLDSSGNSNHGTLQGGMSGSNLVTGKIGNALQFDGSNDYVEFAKGNITFPQGTIESWAWRQPGGAGGAYWFYSTGCGIEWGVDHMWAPGNCQGQGAFPFNFTVSNTNQWNHIAQRVTTGSGTEIFVNGQSVSTQATFTTFFDDIHADNTGAGFASGSLFGGEAMQGYIDELRISDTPRTAGWMATQYSNMNTPSSFYTLAGEVASSTLQVVATGAQVGQIDSSTSNQYTGGSFVLSTTGNLTVNGITISEQGTVNAQTGLDNIKLYYDLDTSAPYDCASESYAGSETQFGSTDTDGFSSANGSSSFTGSISVSSTQTACVYVILDVTASVTGGESLELEITNPSLDVTLVSGTVGPATAVTISGTTLLGDIPTYGNGFSYRRKITFDHTKVMGSQALFAFPVAITGTYSYLKTVGNGGSVYSSSGYDIIFTSDLAGNTKLSHEIESYNPVTGEILIWVKVPVLYHDIATEIYMFYGNSSPTDLQDKPGVWASSYAGVWHANQDPGASAPQFSDSIAAISNGTAVNMVSGDSVTGLAGLGKGLSFDGSNKHVRITDSAELKVFQTITLSAWVNVTSITSNGAIVCRDYRANGTWTSPFITYCLRASNGVDGKPYFEITSSFGPTRVSVNSTAAISNGSWHYIVGSYSGFNLTLYIDGIQAPGSPVSGGSGGILSYAGVATSDLAIGCRSPYSVGDCFNGSIDEVRVASDIRSDGWVETEYNNITSPSTFYAVDSQVGTSDLIVESQGGQTSFLAIASSNVNVGKFVFSASSAITVTGITITENGTVDAQNGLDNIKIRYETDTTAPYNCASESYAGSETQFGSTDTDGFSGANGTSGFNGTMALSPTQTGCVYVIVDVTSSATPETTAEFEITNPTTDISITGGTLISPSTTVALVGTSTVDYAVTVSATGTQAVYKIPNTTNQYMGGRFMVRPNDGFRSINTITIKENGTINAQTHLDNIKLMYDPDGTAPYDCESVAYDGDEGQFGSDDTDGFSSADGTSTFSMGVYASSNSPLCFYVVLDVVTGATTGQTIELEITNPSTDVLLTGVTVYQSTPAAIPGTTTVVTSTTAVVSTTGTQINQLSVNVTDRFVGGAWIVTPASNSAVTSITVSEAGTVNAQTGLDNIKLFYDVDVTSPYNCASELYEGNESQFGATDTDGFNAASGSSTFTGSVLITTTRVMCVYMVLDVTNSATAAQTLEVTITNPSTQVVLAAGTVTPATAVAIAGTTTLRSATTTVNLQVNAAANNGFDIASVASTLFTAPPMALGGKYADGTAVTSGSRFVSVTIPRAATITTAKLDFMEDTGMNYGTTVKTKIYAEAADNSVIFSNSSLPRGRTKTTASVDWDSNGVMAAAGAWMSTSVTAPPPEIATVVQEVVDRASWTSGNALSFIIADDGSNTSAAFGARNYTSAAASAPKLAVTYATTALLTNVTGTQAVNLYRSTTNNYIGGAFVLKPYDAKARVTGITLAELGTVDALNNLKNIKLFYDIDSTAPYDCVSESYSGSESQFGATVAGGFSAANGTAAFTATIDVSLTQALCLYPVVDIQVGAASGNTIEIQVTTPSSQVTVSSGVSTSYGAAALPGTTTILVNALPTVTSVSVNGGSNISLSENTTTPVTVTGTVTDTNGFATIASATGRLYRSGVSGAQACALSDNNCYQPTSATLTGCTGNTCTATLTFNVQYFAEPTDTGSPNAAEYWLGWIQATDTANTTGTGFSPNSTTEMNSLLALSVTGTVTYGSLLPGDNSGSTNGTITVVNTGNRAIDSEISGTSLCSDYPTCAAGVIPVGNQQYKLTAFTYGAGTALSTTPALTQVSLAKPTSLSNPSGVVYWGISLPSTLPEGNYTGSNSIIAVADQ